MINPYENVLERFENDAINRAKKSKMGKHSKDASQLECVYRSPYIATESEGGNWQVFAGCCNHWDCPRCGIIRAKTEYWRIVQGSAEIVESGAELWFLTITTRGAGLSVTQAENGYLQWTNRLLSNLRQQCNRRAQRGGADWYYVQVTERQKRKHPHSHLLTTWRPDDIFDSERSLFEGVKDGYETINGEKVFGYKSAIRSDELQSAICASGLGEQYDLSRVRSVAAVAKYLGKYLFKGSLSTLWPVGWKRVRYSHSWPKSVPLATRGGFPILRQSDWYELATLTDKVTCFDSITAKNVEAHLSVYGVKVRDKSKTDGSPFKIDCTEKGV